MYLFDSISEQTFQSEYLEHLKALETRDEMLDAINRYYDSGELKEDILRIQNGTYSFSAPDEQKLFFGSKGKIRTVWTFPERETYLQRLTVYALHRYDHKFSRCVQTGLKKHIPWETVLRKVHNYDKLYYFTTDIHNCSNSISRELLLGKLDEFIDDDPVLLRFFRDFVQNRECIKKGRICSDRCAVPAGSPLSLFLCNVYLREADSCIEPEADFYARLSDRFVIGCFDPVKLKCLAETALDTLCRLGLQVNEDETFFLQPGESFDFRGKRVSGKEIDFSPATLAALKRSLRKNAAIAKKHLHGMAPGKKALLCIYGLEISRPYLYLKKAFPALTTDRSLRMLDRYVQNLLREIITGKSGNKKYNCTYKDLKRYGYNSLTGQYYRFLESSRQSVKPSGSSLSN